MFTFVLYDVTYLICWPGAWARAQMAVGRGRTWSLPSFLRLRPGPGPKHIQVQKETEIHRQQNSYFTAEVGVSEFTSSQVPPQAGTRSFRASFHRTVSGSRNPVTESEA